MKILEGIQLHELILMILGFILGLVLIFVFLSTALRGKTNLKLLYGFIAPLIMIGYPSIQSIQFSKDVIKIDKLVEQVKQNPTDTAATTALITHIQTLPKSRCVTSSDALSTIANAQAAVGQYDSAKVTIAKAAVINSSSSKVQTSQKSIEKQWQTRKVFENKVEQLKSNIKNLEKNPKSKIVHDSLVQNYNAIKVLDAPIHLAQREVLTVGLAAAIIGETQTAVQVANDVLNVEPAQKDAQKLKDAIKNESIKKRFPPQKVENQPKSTPESRVKLPPVVSSPIAIVTDTGFWRPKLMPKTGVILKKWDTRN